MKMASASDTEKSREELAAEYAAAAVEKTGGIHGLVSGISEAIQKNILRRTEIEGVHADISEDGIAHLDLFVEVDYGEKIPSVAWMLQENVKREIETNTDIKVDRVNVHVQRIWFDAE